jgi:hypothetical protein
MLEPDDMAVEVDVNKADTKKIEQNSLPLREKV